MIIERLISLERILPNPWQPRESEDPEHIKSLAIDIAANGLLQKPVGRVVDGAGRPVDEWDGSFDGEWNIQLAFGHSRLAAYKCLKDNSSTPGKWSIMPVILQKMTDQQMFEMSISENLQRRDLTPIEVAKAMARYRSEFGKTSAEIGQLFGLSDSAVRNKIRLLELPADVQKALTENNVSERAARELLVLFDLPENIRKNAEEKGWNFGKPSEIVRYALKGNSSESIANQIGVMMRSNGVNMDQSKFKHDVVFTGDYRSPDCKSCRLRVIVENDVYCLEKDCFSRKQNAVKMTYLAGASLVSGISVGDPPLEGDYGVQTFHRFWEDDTKQSPQVIGTGCENLRLRWTEGSSYSTVAEYPHAEIVCKRHNGQCVCMRAMKSGVLQKPAAMPDGKKWQEPGKTLAEVFAPEMVVESEPEPAPIQKITADDLKEFDREIRRKKRQELEECKAVREDATLRIYNALTGLNPVVWYQFVKRILSYQKQEKLDKAEPTWYQLMELVAEKIAIDLYDWQYSEPSAAVALDRYNDLFKRAGLPEIVSAETAEVQS